MPLLPGVNLTPASTKSTDLPTQGDKTVAHPLVTAESAQNPSAVKTANDGSRLLEALSLVGQKAELAAASTHGGPTSRP